MKIVQRKERDVFKAVAKRSAPAHTLNERGSKLFARHIEGRFPPGDAGIGVANPFEQVSLANARIAEKEDRIHRGGLANRHARNAQRKSVRVAGNERIERGELRRSV